MWPLLCVARGLGVVWGAWGDEVGDMFYPRSQTVAFIKCALFPMK